MTAAAVALPRAGARPAPVRRGYRFELVKLLAQWPIRLVLLACWLGPALLVAVISQQSSLPADTVFGRWMSQTGWAGSLVVLSFSCSWVLPLLTSLVAGDVFASEDRLGTWRHLLVAVRSPRRIFAAKALASLTVILLLVVGLAASGVVGGLVAVGNRPLVGLDGHLLAPGQAAGRGTARVGQRAGADAGVRGGRAARLGGARPFSDGARDPRAARAAAADCAAASAARRRARRPAELRLHRLARAVHRPGPDRPARRRHRGQPRLGRGRLRARLPALHAPRLHRPGVRRVRPPRSRARGAAVGGCCSQSPSG